jgi:hypothetical protein
VPAAAVRAFEDRAVGESVACVEAYLGGRPLPTPAGTTGGHGRRAPALPP